MDLWIRSQNKTRLYMVKQLDIDDNNYISCGNVVLGKYKTQKRALEVLDEIQKLLTPQVTALADKINANECGDYNNISNVFAVMDVRGNIDVKELSTVVYEMPKDETWQNK